LFCPLEDDVQIANAKVRKLFVVTGEKRKGNPDRPKIPDALTPTESGA
jgi:hypothetical protein